MTIAIRRLLHIGRATAQTQACVCSGFPEIDPEYMFED